MAAQESICKSYTHQGAGGKLSLPLILYIELAQGVRGALLLELLLLLFGAPSSSSLLGGVFSQQGLQIILPHCNLRRTKVIFYIIIIGEQSIRRQTKAESQTNAVGPEQKASERIELDVTRAEESERIDRIGRTELRRGRADESNQSSNIHPAALGSDKDGGCSAI